MEVYQKQFDDSEISVITSHIPTLRFRHFDKKWNLKSFKELVKINQGLQIPISERLLVKEQNTLFYITNEFLKKNSKATYYIKNAPSSVICDEEDILMTRTGNTGMVVTNVSGAFHNNFFKIKYPNYINKDFLVYFLRLPKTQNQIRKLAGTSTIPDLNHTDFYKIKFRYPDLEEQHKISSFLSSVDKRNELLEQKKVKLEEYKKGVMQQIFHKEIRFKNESGTEFPEWEKKTLNNIAKKQSSSISANTLEGNSGRYKIYGASGFLQNIDFFKHSLPYISIVKDGAGVGRTLLCDAFSSVLGTLDVLKPKEETNINFLFYQLNQIRFSKYITGSTIPHIYYKDYSKENLLIPCLEEQNKIGDFLASIDKKIELVKNQIESTKQYKKGLLQQMFI